MSWTLLWGLAESPLNGATVGGSWWLAAPAAPSTTLSWDWGSLCPGYETGPFPVPVPHNGFPHHPEATPQAGTGQPCLSWHQLTLLSHCHPVPAHSQGCSQQRIPRELQAGSPGQGCGTRDCSVHHCHPWQPEQGHAAQPWCHCPAQLPRVCPRLPPRCVSPELPVSTSPTLCPALLWGQQPHHCVPMQ